ncbi:uncharacterized protein HMPREF1541_02882 [Cyphellophora europaea CBS 101466]|uniref:AB hydrolase-1 domain-containing protein n=1 Tax=Cyphellophora europaea (strain CBS 101466) TaxID=1220924 RepID=W2S6Q3_CYPE1|nr:uncharacterized protein HMPREF1541_02882 [Cyphellophora europaea CBS 101466]ETN43723.1 hypothetical protein HMPREF1541_02882 [Cyphellophora europaea CBS 101466]
MPPEISLVGVDCNIASINGLVNIGTHRLHVQVAGPPRKDDQDLIIFIHGTASLLESYAATVRALATKHRVLVFSRSGLGYSDPRPSTNDEPTPPTLDDIAIELSSLLSTLNLKPPFVLVGHSWGGMISTHCIANTSSGVNIPVRGLVILDGGAPTHTTTSPGPYNSFAEDPGTPWAHPCVQQVIQGIVTFDRMNPLPKLALNTTEHEALRHAMSRSQHAKGAQIEFQALFNSYTPFKAHGYLDASPTTISSPTPILSPTIPLALVHCQAYLEFDSLIAEGLSRGNGTPSERTDAQNLLKTWKEDTLANQRQFLRLQPDEKLRRASMAREGTTHNVHTQDPASILGAVEWVLATRAELVGS